MQMEKYDAEISRLRGMNSRYFPRIEANIMEDEASCLYVEFIAEGMASTHKHGEAMMTMVAVVFKSDAEVPPKQIRVYVTEEDEDGGNVACVTGDFNVHDWSQYPEKVI